MEPKYIFVDETKAKISKLKMVKTHETNEEEDLVHLESIQPPGESIRFPRKCEIPFLSLELLKFWSGKLLVLC